MDTGRIRKLSLYVFLVAVFTTSVLAGGENILSGRPYSLVIQQLSKYSDGVFYGEKIFRKFGTEGWVSEDGEVTIVNQKCPAGWLTDGIISQPYPSIQLTSFHTEQNKIPAYLLTPPTAEWAFYFDFDEEMWFDEVVLFSRHNPYDLAGSLPQRFWVMATSDRRTFTLGGIYDTVKEIDVYNEEREIVPLRLKDLRLKGKTLVVIGSPLLLEVEAYGRPVRNDDPHPEEERIYGNTNVFSLHWRSDVYLADRFFYFFTNFGIGSDLHKIRLTVPPEVEIGSSYLYTVRDMGATSLYGKPAHCYELESEFDHGRRNRVETWYWRSRKKGPGYLGPALIESYRSLPDGTFQKAREQKFEMYAVNIPWTKEKPKHLITTGPWFYIYQVAAWPDFGESYGQTGLNGMNFTGYGLLSDMSAHYTEDGYFKQYPLCLRKPEDIIQTKMLPAGIKPVGNFVAIRSWLPSSEQRSAPFLKLQSDGSVKPDERGGICPWYEKERFGEETADDYRKLGAMGFEYFYHDYEPRGWDPKGCFCPDCLRRFQEFIKKHHPELSQDACPEKFVVSKKPEDKFYQNAWMSFWYDFLAERFLMLKRAASEGLSTRGLSPAKFCQLLATPWHDGPYGHHAFHDYATLLKKGVLDDVGTRFGTHPNPLVDRPHLFYRHALPRKVKTVDFPYIQSRGVYNMVSSRYVKEYLLGAFASGLKGILFDTGLGLTPLDYQVLAEVMQQIIPVEHIILEGEPISPGRISIRGGGWGHGLETEKEALIFVSSPWIPDKTTANTKVQVTMNCKVPPKVIDLAAKQTVTSNYVNGIVSFTTSLNRDDSSFQYNTAKILHLLKTDEQ